MSIVSELPVWVIELVNAVIGSVILAVIYTVILMKMKDYRGIIKKVVNMGIALIAWIVLMVEKMQQGMSEANIPFSESKLFYVAVAVAVVSLVHAYVESIEK